MKSSVNSVVAIDKMTAAEMSTILATLPEPRIAYFSLMGIGIDHSSVEAQIDKHFAALGNDYHVRNEIPIVWDNPSTEKLLEVYKNGHVTLESGRKLRLDFDRVEWHFNQMDKIEVNGYGVKAIFYGVEPIDTAKLQDAVIKTRVGLELKVNP